MLVHHRVTTTGGIEERGTEVTICQRHRDRASQHRHYRDQQIRSDQPCPRKHRHLHQRHTRSAHIQNRRNDIDRTHDRRSAHDVHGENTHVHADAHLRAQRRIQSPARCRRAAWHQERSHQQNSCRWQQPERKIIHPSKGHISCADLEWNHPVSKANESRHDRAKHHDQAVHGGQLIEKLRLKQLQTWHKQLSTNAEGQHTAC